jgi:hypothetical protein
MIGACKRAWRCHYVALALSWAVPYAPQLPEFYTCFYNHAHRLRLEKLLNLELSRSFNGF